MGYQGLDFGSAADRLTQTLAQGYKDRQDLENERLRASTQAQQFEAQKAFQQQSQLRQEQFAKEQQQRQLANAMKIAQMHYGVSGSGGGTGNLPPALQKRVDKMADSLDNNLNPYKARGGLLAKTQGVVQAGGRIQTLFKAYPDFNVPKIQTSELSTSIAALLSGGSPQSQAQIHELTPKTVKGDAMSIASWITGNPLGMEQQAFMRSLYDTAMREKRLAQDQVKEAQIQALGNAQELYRLAPKRFEEILNSRGLTPDVLSQYNPDGSRKPPTIPDDIQDPKVRATLQDAFNSGDYSGNDVALILQNARNHINTQNAPAPGGPVVQENPYQKPQNPSQPQGPALQPTLAPPPQSQVPQRAPASFEMPQSPFVSQSPYQPYEPNGSMPMYQGLSQTPYAAQDYSPYEDDMGDF